MNSPTDGRIDPHEVGHILAFDRHFHHPAEMVWAFLVDDDRLPYWLGTGSIEAEAGGRIQVVFAEAERVIDGEVLVAEPYSVLEYEWHEQTADEDFGPVRWKLTTDQDGTHVVLTHHVKEGTDMAKMLAGWHHTLELLAAALDGDPHPWSKEHWQELYDHYAITVI